MGTEMETDKARTWGVGRNGEEARLGERSGVGNGDDEETGGER